MLMLPPGKEINGVCSFDTCVYLSSVKIIPALFVIVKELHISHSTGHLLSVYTVYSRVWVLMGLEYFSPLFTLISVSLI